MVPFDSPWVIPIQLPLIPSSYLSSFLTHLMCNFNDLELGWFKVVKGHGPNRKPLVVSYITSIVSNVVSRTIFKICDTKILWPWIRTVQGHPRSKVMVPIESPWVVSCLTSIMSNIVTLTVFEIVDVKILRPTVWVKKVAPSKTLCDIFTPGEPV